MPFSWTDEEKLEFNTLIRPFLSKFKRISALNKPQLQPQTLELEFTRCTFTDAELVVPETEYELVVTFTDCTFKRLKCHSPTASINDIRTDLKYSEEPSFDTNCRYCMDRQYILETFELTRCSFKGRVPVFARYVLLTSGALTERGCLFWSGELKDKGVAIASPDFKLNSPTPVEHGTLIRCQTQAEYDIALKDPARFVAEHRASSLCITCMEAPKDAAFVPCGHIACCVACSKKQEKCPICRALKNDLLRNCDSIFLKKKTLSRHFPLP